MANDKINAVAFMNFISLLTPALIDIYDHITSDDNDEEKAQQLALDLIRVAKDAEARKRIPE